MSVLQSHGRHDVLPDASWLRCRQPHFCLSHYGLSYIAICETCSPPCQPNDSVVMEQPREPFHKHIPTALKANQGARERHLT